MDEEQKPQGVFKATWQWLEENQPRRGRESIVQLLRDNLDQLKEMQAAGWTVDYIALGLIAAMRAQVTPSTMRSYLYRAGMGDGTRRRGKKESVKAAPSVPVAAPEAPRAAPYVPQAAPSLGASPGGNFPAEISTDDL